MSPSCRAAALRIFFISCSSAPQHMDTVLSGHVPPIQPMQGSSNPLNLTVCP